MKKFVIILKPGINSSDIVTRIKTQNNFVLYENAFFIKTEMKNAEEVYNYITGGPDRNELMVVIELKEASNWGYASKDFWKWMNPEKE